MPPILKGKKYAMFIGCIIGGIGLAIYPIIIDPMINTERYKKIQKTNRAGINQEEVQPGNMKVWTDPFERK